MLLWVGSKRRLLSLKNIFLWSSKTNSTVFLRRLPFGEVERAPMGSHWNILLTSMQIKLEIDPWQYHQDLQQNTILSQKLPQNHTKNIETTGRLSHRVLSPPKNNDDLNPIRKTISLRKVVSHKTAQMYLAQNNLPSHDNALSSFANKLTIKQETAKGPIKLKDLVNNRRSTGSLIARAPVVASQLFCLLPELVIQTHKTDHQKYVKHQPKTAREHKKYKEKKYQFDQDQFDTQLANLKQKDNQIRQLQEQFLKSEQMRLLDKQRERVNSDVYERRYQGTQVLKKCTIKNMYVYSQDQKEKRVVSQQNKKIVKRPSKERKHILDRILSRFE